MKEREIKVHTLLDRFHRAATGRLDENLTGDDWQELSQLVDDTVPILRQLAARAAA